MKKVRDMRLLIAFLLAVTCAFSIAQSPRGGGLKPRVAVFGFINLTGDGAFDVPAETAGTTLFMSLRLLGLYEVSMPESIPRNLGEESLARWCAKNGVDTVLFGTVSDSTDGQEYGLSVFDNAKKSLTVRQTAHGSSVLDVFGVADELIQSTLDSITGRHIGFGSLEFRNDGVTGTYTASVDGIDLGENPGTVDHITSGTHSVVVRQGSADIATISVTVAEGKTATVSFALQAAQTAPAAVAVAAPGPQITEPAPATTGNATQYAAMVSHISSLDGKYIQQRVPKGGFVHRISPFSIGKYEVTYGRWYAVWLWATSEERGPGIYTLAMAGRPGFYGDMGSPPTPETENLPVTDVSWRDCIVWCNAMSEMEGLVPVYYADAACKEPIRTTLGISYYQIDEKRGKADNPYVKKGATGYRLPTSGEWQLAASCGGVYPANHASGSDAAWNQNDGAIDIDGNGIVYYSTDVAWFNGNSGQKSHPVGGKNPNKWGLYDMSGNVREWTFDLKGEAPVFQPTDYAGPQGTGKYRLVRGGSADSGAADLTLGREDYNAGYQGLNYIGFRVARSE
jgi:formylglycine-generating enzyme required for sulfatase activity